MTFSPSADNFPTEPGSPEMVFASSPEGLVSKGDIQAMKRFLMFSGDQKGQDQARNALLQAATNNLACTPAKRVMRMRLYGWPVSVAYRKGVQMPSSVGLGTPQQPQVLLKLRELWSRAFGAASGVLVSPLSACTHLNSVLSANPILLRDCVRHGVSLLAGKAQDKAWTFDTGASKFEQASPELPAAFMFGSYVCWDFDGPEPKLELTADVKLEMHQLSRALFSSQADSVTFVRVGSPVVYHKAITQAQGLQLAAMLHRSVDIGRGLAWTYRLDGERLKIEAMFQDPNSEDDPDFCVEWSYDSSWRPSTHLGEIGLMLELEALGLQKREHGDVIKNNLQSAEIFSKFH